MSLDQHRTASPEQEERESRLVERVVASFDATPDPRLKDLMQALTRHLHALSRVQGCAEVVVGAGGLTAQRRIWHWHTSRPPGR